MSGSLDCYYDPSDGERYPHKWGYTDTRFEFDGPKSVRVTGRRYPLAGPSLPSSHSLIDGNVALIAVEGATRPTPRTHPVRKLVRPSRFPYSPSHGIPYTH